jgi:Protein of unknown function (DUF2786)
MNLELDKIKFKIKALAAKTVDNGCSEHEAMSAMLGVGRLLSQYNLTMEECDVRESPCKTIFIDIGRTKRHPIDSCVTALANLVHAKCWFHRHRGKPSAYAFFGQENDLELVDYLFRVIRAALESEAEAFKQSEAYRETGHPDISATIGLRAGARRSAYVSFQRGMACRIGKRLIELKAQNDAELARYRTTGTALIVLKKQLIEDEWKKEGVRLGKYRGGWRVGNRSAFDQGQQAGDRVNLSRPLTGGGKTNGGLLT